jgi:hypothetical protein
MYRVNQLFRNVLITVDEVIFHAPTKHTLDPRMIEQSIIVSEERLVRTALSDDLYYAISDEKNRTITADNKAAIESLVNASMPSGSEAVVLAEGDIVNAMEFLSADNLSLWKQHLWKFTAECIMLTASPEAYLQFSSEGLIHGAPPAGPMTTATVVSPELRSVKWIMDSKMRDRIDPLTESMHAWICRNKAKYPLYKKECDCDSNGIAYKRKSDIILGLYDEIDNTQSCGCYED